MNYPRLPTAAPPGKKPHQSLTIRSSIAQATLPALAAWLSFKLGVDTETAAIIGAGLYALLASLAQIGLRRAQGFAKE